MTVGPCPPLCDQEVPVTLANPVPELNNWLVNAFNGEWLKIADAKPKEWKSDSIARERRSLEVPNRVF